MSDELWLPSDGLFSKWGFNDGDEPDAWLDWLDANGHPYVDEWHPVLCTLVRTRLLPLLDHRVEVVEIGTNHNPIRAVTVDGVDVEGFWYGVGTPPTLTPDGVGVPFADVLAVCAGGKSCNP